MFEVEKPRKFHYVPRFYDPEKEKWEALKQKYADERQQAEHLAQQESETAHGEGATDEDLAYFQQRVRQLNNEQRNKNTRLGWKDLFRKREMPKFHYESRFDENGNLKNPPSQVENQTSTEDAGNNTTPAPQRKYSPYQIKIRRRFDIGDSDYMKPISGTKIIFYCFLVCLLLYWILF